MLVAGLLLEVRDIHRKVFYDPCAKVWVRDQKEIPYIHLDFIERPALKIDVFGAPVPDDKKLNVGVKAPMENGAHRMEFNYYWLKQYLKFLQLIFDSNEEILVEYSEVPFDTILQYKSKEELMIIARDLENTKLHKQAALLRLYANSSLNPERIPEPCLVFVNEAGKTKTVNWGFLGADGHSLHIPMKKTIYNTSGFANLFERRLELVSELFLCSLKMILAHETAHIARGHWNLRINEPDYSQTRNIMVPLSRPLLKK